MRATFWGTRGSVPTPGPTTVRYGGNTACVEVSTSRGTLVMLDSGTGIRELGIDLFKRGGPVRGHMLLGHTHWDHISGFPFFGPLFAPGNHFDIYGARDVDKSVADVLAGQMHYTYFPVPLGDLQADMHMHELDEGRVEIEDIVVRTQYLNHTSVCMGYRLEADGASVAYITDHEPFGMSLIRPGGVEPDVGLGLRCGVIHDGDRRLIEFIRGANLLIMDTQYTPEEYPQKRGWGHGTMDYVTDVALQAGVDHLALFHHEPTHPDDKIDEMVDFCRRRAADSGSALVIEAAAERGTIEVGGTA